MTSFEVFFLIIGIVFGGMAGLIAMFITYIEFQKLRFIGWKLWKEVLTRALFTFLIFLGLSLLIGFTL